MKQTTIFLGCALVCLLGLGRPASAATDPAMDRELIALLKSDASPGDKAVACKRLAVYGSAEAVPVLAPVLARAH